MEKGLETGKNFTGVTSSTRLQPKLHLCRFYKLSVNDVQLMSILHITLYDGTYAHQLE